KMGIDATRKTLEEGMGREWPDEINMSKEIVEKVISRWKEYGIVTGSRVHGSSEQL
ncbi:MAG: hypothetical protein JRG75_08315, partial [Deltaproteobacteria bacterium]|nr:hypothetical protein [Deltaproteobacteria bacterium]